MRNKLPDLNNHLFSQLEKLSDETITGDKLKEEIARANAITSIASQIIGSAKVTVDALKLVAHGGVDKADLPLLLNNKKAD